MINKKNTGKSTFGANEITELKKLAKEHYYNRYSKQLIHTLHLITLFVSVIAMALTASGYSQVAGYSSFITTFILVLSYMLETADFSQIKNSKKGLKKRINQMLSAELIICVVTIIIYTFTSSNHNNFFYKGLIFLIIFLPELFIATFLYGQICIKVSEMPIFQDNSHE